MYVNIIRKDSALELNFLLYRKNVLLLNIKLSRRLDRRHRPPAAGLCRNLRVPTMTICLLH